MYCCVLNWWPTNTCNLAHAPGDFEQMGKFIRSKGGVLTIEQLAPFLVDSKSELPKLGWSCAEERFVRPALDRFRGEAVLEDGAILYYFRDFQSSAIQVVWCGLRFLLARVDSQAHNHLITVWSRYANIIKCLLVYGRFRPFNFSCVHRTCPCLLCQNMHPYLVSD